MSEIRVDTFKAEDGISAPSFPNGIQVTGVVTATVLDSTVPFLNAGNNIQLGAAGIITATELKATNVSVAGTLTYEDVTNIDSVGIITAREGVFLPDPKQLKIGNTASDPDLKIHHSSGTNIINSTIQEFKNGATALFIFQSLRAYDISYDDINFEGYEIKTL